MESIVTKYTMNCLFCGKPSVEIHHLEYNTGKRPLADADGLTIPLCSEHHRTGKNSVHQNKEMMAMCHMIGQLAYEKQKCYEGMTPDEAREAFRQRYSISYL